MTYELKDILNTVINGNALDELRKIPDNSIDCFVTSSPYYKLRSYGTQPVIWQPTEHSPEVANFGVDKLLLYYDYCKTSERGHEFETINTTLHSGRGGKSQKFSEQEPVKDLQISYAFCKHCNAWRGELGQEPTPDLFLDHLLLIGKEVFRILKPTGTVWFNIADSYSDGTQNKKIRRKSLLQIPKDFCSRMVKEVGFIERNDLIWYKPNVLPQSGKDKFTPDFEYIFFFTKEEKYYFQTQYEPLSDATLRELNEVYTGQATKDYEGAGVQNASDVKRRIIKTFAPIGGTKKAGGNNATYSGNAYDPLKLSGTNAPSRHETREQEREQAHIDAVRLYPDNEEKQKAYIHFIHEHGVNLKGRQKRTVWRISTKPFKDAHFAVYPKDLIRPMLQAGCPLQVCDQCGAFGKAIYHTEPWRVHEPCHDEKFCLSEFAGFVRGY